MKATHVITRLYKETINMKKEEEEFEANVREVFNHYGITEIDDILSNVRRHLRRKRMDELPDSDKSANNTTDQ
jgi:hypothetical protein